MQGLGVAGCRDGRIEYSYLFLLLPCTRVMTASLASCMLPGMVALCAFAAFAAAFVCLIAAVSGLRHGQRAAGSSG